MWISVPVSYTHLLYKEEKALGQKFLVSAILSLDTKLAGVSAVSYTHLDVYKRQIIHRFTGRKMP